jgi:hypothetical protein
MDAFILPGFQGSTSESRFSLARKLTLGNLSPSVFGIPLSSRIIPFIGAEPDQGENLPAISGKMRNDFVVAENERMKGQGTAITGSREIPYAALG